MRGNIKLEMKHQHDVGLDDDTQHYVRHQIAKRQCKD